MQSYWNIKLLLKCQIQVQEELLKSFHGRIMVLTKRCLLYYAALRCWNDYTDRVGDTLSLCYKNTVRIQHLNCSCVWG